MSAFAKQDAMAKEILTKHRGKALAVAKATRAGATTSLLKVACELGQRTVIVAPYIKIFDMTINDVQGLVERKKPSIARIGANREICEKVKLKINKYRSLESLDFHYRPSCKKCELNDPKLCRLQDILSKDYDILGITYAGLKVNCTSESEIASTIINKLKLADNLILDEFVTGVVTTAPSMEIDDPYSDIDKQFDLNTMAITGSGLEPVFWSSIAVISETFKIIADRLEEGKHEIWPNPLSEEDRQFFRDNFANCWKIVENATIEGKDTGLLQKLAQVLAAESFFFSRREGKVSVSAVEDLDEISKGSNYLRGFASEFLTKESKLLAFVDACLPDLNLAQDFSIEVESFNWDDPLSTNKTQLIICDTRRIGKRAFFNDAKIRQQLKQIINLASEVHKPETILVATLSEDMSNEIIQWQKAKEISKEIMVTYYRSQLSRGITVDPNRRNLVLIGAPYLPQIAYFLEAYSSAGKDKAKQLAFRKSDMKSAFINMIGRVKDSKGIQPSIVYALGISHVEAKALTSQADIQSPWVVKFSVLGADAVDFEDAAGLFLHPPVPMSNWQELEFELPILARVLSYTAHKSGAATLSEMFRSRTGIEILAKIVDKHCVYLQAHGLKVNKTSRGYSFETSKTAKGH